MKTTKLYRGYSLDMIPELIKMLKGELSGCSNYTNTLDFSREYGTVVWEFALGENKIITEDISDRKIYVEDYDSGILSANNIDGYRWKISDTGIYHYRVNNSVLKLENIYYIHKNTNKNISNICKINRKFANKTQKEMAQKNAINRVEISDYERGIKRPSLEKIIKLWSEIPVPQKISVSWKYITL